MIPRIPENVAAAKVRDGSIYILVVRKEQLFSEVEKTQTDPHQALNESKLTAFVVREVASDTPRSRNRSQSPSLVISQRSRSICCNTCCPLPEDNHKLHARTCLTFHQP